MTPNPFILPPSSFPLPPSPFILHPSPRRPRRRRRRGVVLLLVISLLALFILLGVTFTIVSRQALNASKLEIKVQATLDPPETEMDLVLGQILYDTQARTVLQYHSLLRDLYGYDHNQVQFPSANTPQPQFRESIQGNVLPVQPGTNPNTVTSAVFPVGVNMPQVSAAGGQLVSFLFALQPFPFPVPTPPAAPVIQAVPLLTNIQAATVLSDIPNYYSGRVLTFTTGLAANRSARIVSYNPVVGYTQHQPNGGTSLVDSSLGTPAYFPAYGQITIELIESVGGIALPINPGDSFIINGAPFNGAGAGYDPITRNLDGVLVHRSAINPALPLTAVFFANGLIENPALLPNYASYSNDTLLVFDQSTTFETLNRDSPQYIDPSNLLGNKARTPNTIGLGGLDEPWDTPDYQNMFLAMVPPRAAESLTSTPPAFLPIIPSFHRPELVNYWINFIREKILEGQFSISRLGTGYQTQLRIIAFPYGLDRIPGTAAAPGDDPTDGGLTLEARHRIHNIMQGCIFRPMPWDHPNFSGSNSLLTVSSPPLTPAWYNELELTFNNLINSPSPQLNPDTGITPPIDNRLTWDVDTDNDGIPDSIWIDPGLPIVTMPDGRRVKRLAAILIKDLDGSININAHGNLQQALYVRYNAGDAAAVSAGRAINFTAGLASNADVPRGLGFGPAEVNFSNIFGQPPRTNFLTDPPTNYENLIRGRYVSTRSDPAGIPDNYAIDTAYKNTNLPFAAPGLPYRREALAAIKHNGVPANYAGTLSNTAQPNLYASPPDVWGRGAVVLDWGGQPLFLGMGEAFNPNAGFYNSGEVVDSPYEICLNGAENGADSPYTVAELELLLRYHDPDASQLSKRLINLAPLLRSGTGPGVIDRSHTFRSAISTLSSNLPVPATAIPPELRSFVATNSRGRPGSASILDLYYAKLAAAGLSGTALTNELQRIAPWEFFKGQKFDLNRAFGDGVDNNNNGARDDAGESPTGPVTLTPTTAPAAVSTYPNHEYAWVPTNADEPSGGQAELHERFYNIQPFYINSAVKPGIISNNQFARQLYARHLFCLGLLFLPDEFKPNFNIPPISDGNLPGGANSYRWAVRRIAQWAVNCVDFRDSDSIMTAFEFDYNPWDGWQVDGNLTTDGGATVNENTPGVPLMANPLDRGVVWGIEAPDLLITETLAFHDRRVKDTDRAGMMDTLRGDMTNPDPTLDQYRIPQGSLFVELYCPRPPRWPSQTDNQKPQSNSELFYPNRQLELAGQAPGGQPIWRLAITSLGPQTAGSAVVTNPETSLLDPTNIRALFPSGTAAVPEPDRFVYFTGSVPPADAGRAFCNSSNLPTRLSAGSYALIGPRLLTHLGSKDKANSNVMSLSAWGGNSDQRIELDTTTAPNVEVTDTTATVTSRTEGTDVSAPLALVCDMPAGTIQPTGWAAPSPWGIGMNVTEPLPGGNYYPEPTYAPSSLTGTIADFYDDPDAPFRTFKPEPVDTTRTLGAQTMLETGTYANASSVLLQRLADPTRPFDPALNPYITVDWAQIDVTVFSGEEDSSRQVGMPPAPIDPDDTDPNDTTTTPKTNPLSFFSRQRGFLQPVAPTTGPIPRDSRLWSTAMTRNSTYPTTLTIPSADGSLNATGAYFTVNLSNSQASANTYNADTDRHSLGSLNSTLDYPYNPGATSSDYRGEATTNPFPWFNWNNRPFTNALELLSVPSSAPSRVYLEMTPGFPNLSAITPLANHYTEIVAANDPVHFHFPFGHLPNFFKTTKTTTTTTPLESGKAPHLYRLLDFVEVPSAFSGTERWYNASNFAGSTFVTTYPPDWYWAPFNKLSRFRDPGRINVNTIFDFTVWDAATAQSPGLRGTAFFNDLLGRSRRGELPVGGTPNWYDKHPYLPSRFANPVRPADSADLMPNASATEFRLRLDNPIDATLLRPTPGGTGANLGFGDTPLFQLNFIASPDDNHRNTQRNPYFRFQGYQKLGNILSTTSNCFAVWITIGYFEVEENRVTTPGPMFNQIVYDAAHSDGYALSQEAGVDSGQVSRHRAFFVIDRSIPVGFSPGSRLNTDECVLIRRLIE